MIVAHFALIIAALFTGAAVYINLVEQPARLRLGDVPLLAEWQASYPRAATLQAPLALLGGVCGILAYSDLGDWRLVLGACLMLVNWPFTLIVIGPVNRRLTAAAPTDAGPTTRDAIRRWGWMHAGRSTLGGLATVAFLLSVVTM